MWVTIDYEGDAWPPKPVRVHILTNIDWILGKTQMQTPDKYRRWILTPQTWVDSMMKFWTKR